MKSANNESVVGVGTKVYLLIWSINLLLHLLDGTVFGIGAGGLDVRPLFENDYKYLYPVIYALLGSLALSQNESSRLTISLGCAAHAVDLYIRWQRMPTVWDHEQWAMNIEVAFLLAFLPACFSSTLSAAASSTTTITASPETAFLSMARAQFVLLYAAATFWKHNSSFFDTTVSCGTVLILETIATYVPTSLLTDNVTVALGQVSPHITMLTEGAIALTMAMSATRDFAVLFGTVFHLTIFLLPVNAAGGFSMDCTTRFIVFFSSAELVSYATSASWIKECLIAAVTTVALVGLRYKATGYPFDFGFMGMCLLTVFYTRLILSSRSVEHKAAKKSNGPTKLSWYHSGTMVVACLLTVTYGFLTPILGVQHMGAPTMYSNLRYYGRGNHYLVPTSILSDDILYGGGIVQILESTSEAVNRRLAYVSSEDVFPPTTLEKIRLATTSESLPVQFLPLVMSNPQSRAAMLEEYMASNPVGSSNQLPFLLPISDLRKALQEEEPDSSFVVKLLDAGTSSNLKEVALPIPDDYDNVVVLKSGHQCEIQTFTGEKIGSCESNRAAQLIATPIRDDWATWLVSKLQTPYPQIAGIKEEICMS